MSNSKKKMKCGSEYIILVDSDSSIKSFTLANVQAQSSPLPITKTSKFNYGMCYLLLYYYFIRIELLVDGIAMGSASQFLREMEQDSLDEAGGVSALSRCYYRYPDCII